MKRRILCIILTLCMLLGVAPLTVTAADDTADGGYQKGDIIEFGSYPQSKVTNPRIISALDGFLTDDVWVSYDYYIGTDTEYDGKMTASDYMKYADLELNGEKYRAVRFSQYRPTVTSDVSSEATSVQDNNGYELNTTYFFKYEPLTWTVLDPEEGYVMSNIAIDAQAYENFSYYDPDSFDSASGPMVYNGKDCKYLANDWSKCSLREWLNKDFYNTAFTAEEKAQIGKTYLDNTNTFSSKYDCAGTFDKIFTISIIDAINSDYGFDEDGSSSDFARIKPATDYAMCQGAEVVSYTGGNIPYWWLRTTGLYGAFAFGVAPSGWIVSSGGGYYNVNRTDMGVVPAFKFNPKTPTLAKGSKIEFGSYPQSEVKDTALIAELDKLDKNWKSYDYSYGTDRWEDQLSYLDMNYADISYGGEKYRAVTFSQYRPNIAYRRPTDYYSCQGSNGYFIDHVYYFKYEPLKWRVIDPVEGFVICTQAIDSRAYRENYYRPDNNEYYCFVDYERYASDWEASEIRTWLNGDFSSTAFTDDELSKIGTTENESKSTEDSKYDGAKSYDKVFLLSYDEAVNDKYGFNTDKDAEDSARQMTTTDYAKCQGIDAVDSSTFVGWICRSPYDSAFISGVSKEGIIAIGRIDITAYGIVPAFKLNPAGYEISVTFDLNGGEWADGYTAPTSYLSNEALQFPTDANVKKTGLMFEGWEETSRSDTSVSYKAKWTAKMYDLKYTLDYKDTGITDKNELLRCVEYGKDYVYTFDTAPKGCEYIVDNFYVKISDASGDMQLLDKSKYAIDTENCTITIPGELVKGNIEIYIERDWKNYTVKFKDTGSATIADKTVHWNDKVLDGVADPTRDDGYEFMGWVAENPKPWVATANTTYGEIADDDSLTTITLLGAWKDIIYPSIIGLEDGKTYCGARKFEVKDNGSIAAVFVNNTYAQPDNDGLYTAPVADGAYEIIVLDGGGNKTKITITVNADHSYGDWKFDDTNHWKECANGDSVIEKGEHTYEWITDKEATETETGVAHEECSVCHAKRNENTEVPKLPTKLDMIREWFIGLFVKLIKWIVDFINDVC